MTGETMKKTNSPLYQSVAAYLREGIASQKWKPGDVLPSETQLCRDFGVSRGTVVKALEMLISDGLAQRRQGVGTFVSRPALHRMPGFLTSFSETVKEQGRSSTQQLLSERELSRTEALQFGCGEPALELSRIRYVDDAPLAIHRSVIPLAVAEKVTDLYGPGRKTSDPHFSLYKCFAKAGIIIDHADETLNVRLATAEEAGMLDIALPAAVMMIHRNSFDPSGRHVEAIEAIYLGESYTYETRLVRTDGIAFLPSSDSPQKIKRRQND